MLSDALCTISLARTAAIIREPDDALREQLHPPRLARAGPCAACSGSFTSAVAGEPALELSVVEQCRYTTSRSDDSPVREGGRGARSGPRSACLPRRALGRGLRHGRANPRSARLRDESHPGPRAGFRPALVVQHAAQQVAGVLRRRRPPLRGSGGLSERPWLSCFLTNGRRLKLPSIGKADPAEQERLLKLFWNRAELGRRSCRTSTTSCTTCATSSSSRRTRTRACSSSSNSSRCSSAARARPRCARALRPQGAVAGLPRASSRSSRLNSSVSCQDAQRKQQLAEFQQDRPERLKVADERLRQAQGSPPGPSANGCPSARRAWRSSGSSGTTSSAGRLRSRSSSSASAASARELATSADMQESHWTIEGSPGRNSGPLDRGSPAREPRRDRLCTAPVRAAGRSPDCDGRPARQQSAASRAPSTATSRPASPACARSPRRSRS